MTAGAGAHHGSDVQSLSTRFALQSGSCARVAMGLSRLLCRPTLFTKTRLQTHARCTCRSCHFGMVALSMHPKSTVAGSCRVGTGPQPTPPTPPLLLRLRFFRRRPDCRSKLPPALFALLAFDEPPHPRPVRLPALAEGRWHDCPPKIPRDIRSNQHGRHGRSRRPSPDVRHVVDGGVQAYGCAFGQARIYKVSRRDVRPPVFQHVEDMPAKAPNLVSVACAAPALMPLIVPDPDTAVPRRPRHLALTWYCVCGSTRILDTPG